MRWSARCAGATFAVLAGISAASAAAQQTYPSKPIRFIVGFSPGGVNDIISRLLAHELTKGFGQQVIVDNRAGANGIIANGIAAGAAADGYTILLVPTSFAIDMAREAKLPYDPKRDFAPVTLVASAPLVLVVNPSLPVKSVRDLIELARSKPGQLSFAHAGTGNLTHIAGEMLKSMTGLNVVAVAYKGGGAALRDVVSGQVQFGIPTMPPALGHIASGKLRPLGVTGARRAPILAGVPTIAEAGVPGYEATGWWAVLVPRGTPSSTIDRLNREISRALRVTDTKERLASLGAEPVGNSPKELSAFLSAETNKWKKVIKAAGVRIE